jgi:hypothetical protein
VTPTRFAAFEVSLTYPQRIFPPDPFYKTLLPQRNTPL